MTKNDAHLRIQIEDDDEEEYDSDVEREAETIFHWRTPTRREGTNLLDLPPPKCYHALQ